MSKIHIKLVTFLLLFGFTAGMVTDTASNFNNEPTTAQASTKLTATQKSRLQRLTPVYLKHKWLLKTGLLTMNQVTATPLVTETVTAVTNY